MFDVVPLVVFIKSHLQQRALLFSLGSDTLPLLDPGLIGPEWNTCCWQSIKAPFPGKAKWSVLFCWARLDRSRVPWRIATTWQRFFHNDWLLHYPMHMVKKLQRHACNVGKHFMLVFMLPMSVLIWIDLWKAHPHPPTPTPAAQVSIMKVKFPTSKRWQHQSIELVLKQNHTLCLFGHWFESGQPANGLMQPTYCGQHNMVSREQQVSWPHSDTIRKREKTHKKHVSSLGFILIHIYSFFLFRHIEARAAFSWWWQGEQIAMKYALQLWNIQHFYGSCSNHMWIDSAFWL